MAQHMEVRPGVEQDHFRHAYPTSSPALAAYQTPSAGQSYVGASSNAGLKTPSPSQPVYNNKRQDSVHQAFNARDLSQHPSYSSSFPSQPAAGAMNSQHGLGHQHSLSHNHYGTNAHATTADAGQSQSQGHAPHSSVSSAASTPSYYTHYQHQQSLPGDTSPDAGQPQAHGHASHSTVNSAAPAHSYYPHYSHQQSLSGESGADGGQPQTHGHAPHSSVSSAASAPSYYPHYSHQQSLPSGIGNYVSSAMSVPRYASYSAGMGVNSASGAGAMQNTLMHQNHSGIPSMSMGAPGLGQAQAPQSDQQDTTGQVAPHGVKPRVTATLWEDEATLCFQVETNGICVARREDNHMINGTKLLNVAGMTRGRRDGILKSEKNRAVVKIGPMHLKGVWIPYERALEFANKEKITERLYPLFVHNIGSLLYHNPSNPTGRPGVASSTVPPPDSRRAEGDSHYMRSSQSSQAPPLQHHHSMSGSSMSGATQMPPLQHHHSFSGSISGQGGASNHAQLPSARPVWSPSSSKRGIDFEDDDQTNGWKRSRTIHDDAASRPMIPQQQRS